jgi:hypothetical protein
MQNIRILYWFPGCYLTRISVSTVYCADRHVLFIITLVNSNSNSLNVESSTPFNFLHSSHTSLSTLNVLIITLLSHNWIHHLPSNEKQSIASTRITGKIIILYNAWDIKISSSCFVNYHSKTKHHNELHFYVIYPFLHNELLFRNLWSSNSPPYNHTNFNWRW